MPSAPATIRRRLRSSMACDRLGMVVIDEAFDCFDVGKNSNDYHIYFNKWWPNDINAMVFATETTLP